MYKKTGESAHYLPRKGSFSTVPQRNGRVDVLPPDAGMALYDTAQQLLDAKHRLEQLHKERIDCERLLHSLGRIDDLRRKVGSGGSEAQRTEELKSTRARIDRDIEATKRAIRKHTLTLGGGSSTCFEQVFVALAESELPHDVFAALKSKAHSIFDKVKKR